MKTNTHQPESPRTARARKRRAGSTMIEAMVTLTVLGTFVAGATQLNLSSRELSDRARAHYQAVHIAKNRIERLQVLPFAQLELAEEDRVRVSVEGSPDARGHFRRTTMVTEISSGLREAYVKVELQDRTTLDFDGGTEELRTWITDFQTVNQ